MTTLYLHYRNSGGDPWTAVPSLAAAFPTLVSGALPLASIAIETAPEAVTPCGCPGASTTETHLALRAECSPIPLALFTSVITFLNRYKTATYHEAKSAQYGQGVYMTAAISLLEAKESNGMVHLSFRLAAAIADSI